MKYFIFDLATTYYRKLVRILFTVHKKCTYLFIKYSRKVIDSKKNQFGRLEKDNWLKTFLFI